MIDYITVHWRNIKIVKFNSNVYNFIKLNFYFIRNTSSISFLTPSYSSRLRHFSQN